RRYDGDLAPARAVGRIYFGKPFCNSFTLNNQRFDFIQDLYLLVQRERQFSNESCLRRPVRREVVKANAFNNLGVEQLVDPQDDVFSAAVGNIKTDQFLSRIEVLAQLSKPSASTSLVDGLPRITYQAKTTRNGRLSGSRPVAKAFTWRTSEFDK